MTDLLGLLGPRQLSPQKQSFPHLPKIQISTVKAKQASLLELLYGKTKWGDKMSLQAVFGSVIPS